MTRLATFSLGLIFGFCAHAAPSRNPGFREFHEYCQQHRTKPQHLRLTAPEIGTIAHFPTWSLQGSQARFSWASFKRKLQKGLEFEPNAYIDKNLNKWVFGQDNHRAFYPLTKAIKAIYYRGELFIVDGHHRALISTYLGAETIPVEIIGDKSDLSPMQFRRQMEREKKSYFRDHNGKAVDVVDLCSMLDDPNLELARILIGRVDVTFKKQRLILTNLRGSRWTIGIKTEQDMPYLEFEVADTLRRHGIAWDNSNDPDISYVKLEKFLEILKEEAKRPGSRLKNVLLFDKPSRASKLNLREILQEHLIKIGCEKLLTPEGIPNEV